MSNHPHIRKGATPLPNGVLVPDNWIASLADNTMWTMYPDFVDQRTLYPLELAVEEGVSTYAEADPDFDWIFELDEEKLKELIAMVSMQTVAFLDSIEAFK